MRPRAALRSAPAVPRQSFGAALGTGQRSRDILIGQPSPDDFPSCAKAVLTFALVETATAAAFIRPVWSARECP